MSYTLEGDQVPDDRIAAFTQANLEKPLILTQTGFCSSLENSYRNFRAGMLQIVVSLEERKGSSRPFECLVNRKIRLNGFR